MENRPKYLVKVHQSWNYGPRARFWDIMKWVESDRYEKGGYWTEACRGGLAYSERGMWRAINKRLKKMQFGYHENYFTLDREPYKHPNCSDADTDICRPNDPNCMWRTYKCEWCKKTYKISQRALTGKYMISDHNKTCKEFKKANKGQK
jgi:hypothetical protein